MRGAAVQQHSAGEGGGDGIGDISNFRFQISDFRFQISDFRFQISDFRFQISDFRVQNSEFERREGAAEAIAGLHGMGVRPLVMLTGDNRKVAAAVGASLGLDEVRAELHGWAGHFHAGLSRRCRR